MDLLVWRTLCHLLSLGFLLHRDQWVAVSDYGCWGWTLACFFPSWGSFILNATESEFFGSDHSTVYWPLWPLDHRLGQWSSSLYENTFFISEPGWRWVRSPKLDLTRPALLSFFSAPASLPALRPETPVPPRASQKKWSTFKAEEIAWAKPWNYQRTWCIGGNSDKWVFLTFSLILWGRTIAYMVSSWIHLPCTESR